MKSLKSLRLIRGQSQFALSLQTQIPNYRLSRLESGKAAPTQDELVKIADALKTTTELLQNDVTEEKLRAVCV